MSLVVRIVANKWTKLPPCRIWTHRWIKVQSQKFQPELFQHICCLVGSPPSEVPVRKVQKLSSLQHVLVADIGGLSGNAEILHDFVMWVH